ncbi:MAG: gamma-glutamyl-gamma-aminobutyrate hydrolase family protein [Anaerolineales bacterium]|nr:gamma-glutamyl-gamma-aminobutyrate hydrolase family protein [Anaerolineales bacterium]
MAVPLIGLTTRNDTHPKKEYPIITSPRSYPDAIIRAGAIPVLIPVNLQENQIPDLLNQLDGIIFTGGGDIALDHFAGEPHEKIYNVDPERDAIELNLARRVTQTQIPFLGICRGFQVLNVALGGSLYTHIEDQLPGSVKHACFTTHPTDHHAHRVKLKTGSLLAQIYQNQEVMVNSLHHQGAKEIASQWDPIGQAPDGLVEAIALPGHPFGLGVQWHPEWMPEDQTQRKLFSAFVQAAADYRAKRRKA